MIGQEKRAKLAHLRVSISYEYSEGQPTKPMTLDIEINYSISAFLQMLRPTNMSKIGQIIVKNAGGLFTMWYYYLIITIEIQSPTSHSTEF